MAIPNQYQTATEAVLNFDSTDFITREGHITLYPCDVINKLLVRETIYSSGGFITSNVTNVQFPVKFKTPAIMQGNSLIQISSIMKNTTGGNQDMTHTITANIIHKSGTTESVLASGAQIHFVSQLAAAGLDNKILSYNFDVSRTIFKPEDQLILALWSTSSGTGNHLIGIDPVNRTSLEIGTWSIGARSTFIAAFKINL